MVEVCHWFGRYALRALSLSVFRSSFIVCGCACSSCHNLTVVDYLHLLNKALWCLTDITRSTRCSISSASWWLYICRCRCHLLVTGWCYMNLGCLGVDGATDGCTVGAVGSCWTAYEDDGVVTGCPATSTLGVHVRPDSIWMMFMNVFSCLNVLSSTNSFHDVGAIISSMCYSGREPQCPVIVYYRNSLSCI